MRLRAALLLACCCTWIACSTPYREDHAPNLTFSAPGLRGSFLSSTRVSLGIFFAEQSCDSPVIRITFQLLNQHAIRLNDEGRLAGQVWRS